MLGLIRWIRCNTVSYRIMTAAAVVLICAMLGSAGADAATRRCEGDALAVEYLSRPVEGLTPAVIADAFIEETILPEGEQHADTVRRLRAALVAFEGARVAPETAAELLAGDWSDWRSEHMTRDEFTSQFLAEVSSRRDRGVPDHGAVLQAAQALRNRLDDMSGAAGMRDAPEDAHVMWLWDSYIRGKAAAAEIEQLQASPDGDRYWDDYLMTRRTAIGCAAASAQERVASSGPPVPTARPEDDEGLSDGAKVAIGIGAAILMAIIAGSADDDGSGEASTGTLTAPACGQDYRIEPSKMPCGSQWRPWGEWPQKFWCYTDYNMQIGGSLGVTYCTNGAGTWEMSGVTHPCNGAEGWCDNYGMGPRPGFWQ